MPKIAVLNGFPFHYEVFGGVIDYCLQRKFEIDIYTNEAELIEWFSWYQSVFAIQFKIYSFFQFRNDSTYDRVFMLTDDDHHVKNEYIDDRYICISHTDKNRRPQIRKQIDIRPFPQSIMYALPVYSFQSIETKKRSLSVICLGHWNVIDSIDTLTYFKKLFTNFSEIQFVFVSRQFKCNVSVIAQTYKNLLFLEAAPARQMMNMVSQASHTFVSAHKNIDRIDKVMSGSIPIAIGGLCQIILPTKMNDYYKFQTAITYDDTTKLTLTLPDLTALEEEKQRYLKIRNEVYDFVFSM